MCPNGVEKLHRERRNRSDRACCEVWKGFAHQTGAAYNDYWNISLLTKRQLPAADRPVVRSRFIFLVQMYQCFETRSSLICRGAAMSVSKCQYLPHKLTCRTPTSHPSIAPCEKENIFSTTYWMLSNANWWTAGGGGVGTPRPIWLLNQTKRHLCQGWRDSDLPLWSTKMC